MNTREKLSALRILMKRHGVDAYFVPSVDPHQSEYVPDCWKRRAWLSGFTGSAGDLLITAKKAALWTDSRYWLQAEAQLEGSGIQLMRIGQPDTPPMVEWAGAQLRRGERLAVDPQVMSMTQAGRFESALGARGVEVRYLEPNLVDALWADRPYPSRAPLVPHSARLAGEKAEAKLERLREAMRKRGAKAHVLAALDAIAWLFNVRSRDIAYTPVAIAYAVITLRGATLYLDLEKVGAGAAKALRGVARLEQYEDFPEALQSLAAAGAPVLLDPDTTNRWVADQLAGAELILGASPVFALKSIKNPTQIEAITRAHVRDGLAMVKFLRWLERAVPKGGVTEVSAAQKVDEFRAEDPTFVEPSFGTISAYGAHAAIVHYTADESTDVPLRPRGLYLIDSGGQYPEGTTDITRTVALGPPGRREREAFTRVLRGHIACARTPFPAGTTGQRHELFARGPLWEGGLNYGHGTGHGLGQFLGVHEGPVSMKDVPTVPMEPGHLLSIEPGHYEAGRFGIRIENLAFVVPDRKLSRDGQAWHRFEPVSLCPIDLRLVDRKMLQPEERDWLNRYHERVRKTLSKHLDRDHRRWLQRATRGI